jgi:predicted nucleic-acid-binding protein
MRKATNKQLKSYIKAEVLNYITYAKKHNKQVTKKEVKKVINNTLQYLNDLQYNNKHYITNKQLQEFYIK